MHFLKLIFDIYISAFYMIKRILFERKSNVELTSIKVKSTNEFYLTAIANSITLTPGTITIEKKGSDLTVLCFKEQPTRKKQLKTAK